LGKDIGGREGFDFDIRIQKGAGAYICGEETALISSCEGDRGDPKNRPPFPVQKGYLGHPTCVNNVETLCKVTRIVDMGPAWFASMGTSGSPGTKLLSISGDCASPGVYEFPFGTPLRQILKEAGAMDTIAVQVGGPSGLMVPPDQFDQKICYTDLATGGAVMIFGPKRDPVVIAQRFLEFFCEESCGYCAPCRVGNQLIRKKLECILEGLGTETDLQYLNDLANVVKNTSRCGLGQSSPNCVLSLLKNFPDSYKEHIDHSKYADNLFHPTFDPLSEVSQSSAIAGRPSKIF
jgi:[NiFe] hydrogenase diaphorase moiety large subunit